ncbi:MAG TPA: prepilin-type N-terminal cleavage/methylation domain-containing protein [Methylophilus sp.]|uniref:type IV pilin protein n=1 Tax=Methylophilus sp. TaxID=29541 RepID=UPI002C1B978E|nr:prepilin-type N-terminal cleavage/methylation domain-containing protein [Methylophilus sp.]HSH86768.1 prepilin-type N-terminal cleavage/methylation domain-containing protein [Methylophilus sp.]
MRNGKYHVIKRITGFTLVELLVVLSILALLLSLAVPRYFSGVQRAKEQALKQQLATTRKALDEFFSDQGQYPDTLQELVDKHYLDKLPWDTISESNDTWVITAPELPMVGGVYTLHSSAAGQAADGSLYTDW